MDRKGEPVNKKKMRCSVCKREVEQDLDALAAEQDDPAVAQMIADGELMMLACECGAATGFYFSIYQMNRAGQVGMIECVMPSALEDDKFIRQIAKERLDKRYDSNIWVFSMEELKHQARLWKRVEELRRSDIQARFESKGGG